MTETKSTEESFFRGKTTLWWSARDKDKAGHGDDERLGVEGAETSNREALTGSRAGGRG